MTITHSQSSAIHNSLHTPLSIEFLVILTINNLHTMNMYLLGLTHLRGGDMNTTVGGRPSKSGTATSGSGLSTNTRGSTNPNGTKDNATTGQTRTGKNKDGNKGTTSQGSSSSGNSSSALGSSSLGNQSHHNSSNRLTIEINSLNFPPLAGSGGDKGTTTHAVEESTKTVLDDMITKVISGTTPTTGNNSSSEETVTHRQINNIKPIIRQLTYVRDFLIVVIYSRTHQCSPQNPTIFAS